MAYCERYLAHSVIPRRVNAIKAIIHKPRQASIGIGFGSRVRAGHRHGITTGRRRTVGPSGHCGGGSVVVVIILRRPKHFKDDFRNHGVHTAITTVAAGITGKGGKRNRARGAAVELVIAATAATGGCGTRGGRGRINILFLARIMLIMTRRLLRRQEMSHGTMIGMQRRAHEALGALLLNEEDQLVVGRIAVKERVGKVGPALLDKVLDKAEVVCFFCEMIHEMVTMTVRKKARRRWCQENREKLRTEAATKPSEGLGFRIPADDLGQNRVRLGMIEQVKTLAVFAPAVQGIVGRFV
jgi:hypothetical protein